MSAIVKTKSDPRFLRGLSLMKENRYEEAVEVFSEFMQSLESQNPDDLYHLSLGPVYYEYGNALLRLAEQSTNVFGDLVKNGEESNDEETIDEEIDNEDQDQDQDQESNAENTTNPSTATDDLELAWEMLELARLIYSKHDGEEVEHELGQVVMRLGDVSMESGNFSQSKEDYSQALLLHSKRSCPDSRDIAGLHCCIAMSCMYMTAGNLPEADIPATREEALGHYIEARSIIAADIRELSNKCSVEFSPYCTKVLEALPVPTKSIKGKGKGHTFNVTSIQKLPSYSSNTITTTTTTTSTTATTTENMNETEKKMIDLIEIYNDLQERIDEITGASKILSVEEKGEITTIGFGTPETKSASLLQMTTSTSSTTTTTTSTTTHEVKNLVARKKKVSPSNAPPSDGQDCCEKKNLEGEPVKKQLKTTPLPQ